MKALIGFLMIQKQTTLKAYNVWKFIHYIEDETV